MATKQKTPSITNAEISRLMSEGVIELVDGLTSPRVVMRGRELTPQYNEQGGRQRIYGGKRWRYTLRYNGKRRSVLRSTLVWLWYFAEIPDDCNVHHCDAGKDVDGLFNLDCLTTADHAAFHYGGDCAF